MTDMIMRFNSHMRRVMGDALKNLDSVDCELPPEFAAQLEKMRIVEVDGAVVVVEASGSEEGVANGIVKDASGWGDYYTDLTHVECSVNHYHIDHPGDGSLRASATAGIVAAKEFKRMIEATKIPGDFLLIVSANYNPDPNPPFYGAVVRFHKLRPAEKSWLGNDLDLFKRECVLTIEWTNPV